MATDIPLDWLSAIEVPSLVREAGGAQRHRPREGEHSGRDWVRHQLNQALVSVSVTTTVIRAGNY